MLENKDIVSSAETTTDGLLNRRIAVEQLSQGYRVAIDTVLLASAVPARAGEKILELGCGVGGAMLCLAARVPNVHVLGLEIQPDLALLCRDNIMRNKLKAYLGVQIGDAAKLSPAMAGVFHHVMMNPPYHDEATHDVSAQKQKRVATTEKSGDLALWIANAAHALKQGGILTIIHRADRMDEIIGHMSVAFGVRDIIRFLPKEGAGPKRVIIRAKKGAHTAKLITHDIVLHQADGRYTSEADAILRDGAALGQF